MLYTGQFKSKDNKTYRVDIQTGTDTTQVPIQFTGDVCSITTSSSGLLSPIKSRGIKISILSKDYYMDLYDPVSRGTSINVWDMSGVVAKNIFHGWLTPCIYDQGWSWVDSIDLEGVDCLSTTKDYVFKAEYRNYTFTELFKTILKDCGYRGLLYVPNSYRSYNDIYNFNSCCLDTLSISGANFYDDDDEHTPWTQYDVLEELCKFLGWSLVPDGDDIWLIDYRYISNGYRQYYKTDLNSWGQYSLENKETTINVSSVRAAGESSISVDDIYNKIEISDNLYEIDEISPDIFEDNSLISITKEGQIGTSSDGIPLEGSQWTITTTKNFLWWETERSTEISGYDYQTFFRLDPKTGWKHRYYRKSDLIELTTDPEDPNYGKEYYDPDANIPIGENRFIQGNINKYLNTAGCLIQRYAHVKNEGANNLPASVDWEKYLTFFITDSSTPNFPLFAEGNKLGISKFELPVLEYTTSENINWKPTSGTSWITLKGDIYYQYNGANYGDKNKDILNIIVDGKQNASGDTIFYYSTAPVDKAVSINERSYMGLSRKKSDPNYGAGFRLWKMNLSIGNKWWDGEEWVDFNTDFYINYNNSPDGSGDEYVQAFSWMSMVNNKNYKDKVGVDGYCIPISADDDNAPASGVMKLKIYIPAMISPDLANTFMQYYKNYFKNLSWAQFAPVIYVKDFKLGYVYTDTSVWYSMGSTDNDDKVYTGYIDTNNVKDFDGLSLKINTAIDDRPISRSYVVLKNGGYLKTMKHIVGDDYKEQEFNVVDNYLDHHSDRRVIYNTNVHGLYSPNTKMNYNNQYNNSINGVYFIDSQSYNLYNDNNDITLVQY